MTTQKNVEINGHFVDFLNDKIQRFEEIMKQESVVSSNFASIFIEISKAILE